MHNHARIPQLFFKKNSVCLFVVLQKCSVFSIQAKKSYNLKRFKKFIESTHSAVLHFHFHLSVLLYLDEMKPHCQAHKKSSGTFLSFQCVFEMAVFRTSHNLICVQKCGKKEGNAYIVVHSVLLLVNALFYNLIYECICFVIRKYVGAKQTFSIEL